MAEEVDNWKHPSPVGFLHEAVVAHRRAFLENAVARVYRRFVEDAPVYRAGKIVREERQEWWGPSEDTLARRNERIRAAREDVEFWRRQRRKPPNMEDLEREAQTPLWTPESFADDLIEAYGYDGREWKVADTLVEEVFDEDKGRAVVKTRWFIPDGGAAGRIERSATAAAVKIQGALAKLKTLHKALSLDDPEAAIRRALFDGRARWHAGEVRWGYLRDLDRALGELREPAMLAGDGPFLSLIGAEDRGRLVIDARSFSIAWQDKTRKIGDKQPFWLLYALGECHGDWVGAKTLVDRGCAGDVDDSLKQVAYHLRKGLRADGHWKAVADAIESRRGAYRLNCPWGIRLVPPNPII